MGPIGAEKEDGGFSVNFTRSTNYQHIEGFADQDRKRDELTHQLERLWTHDFQDLNSSEKVSRRWKSITCDGKKCKAGKWRLSSPVTLT